MKFDEFSKRLIYKLKRNLKRNLDNTNEINYVQLCELMTNNTSAILLDVRSKQEFNEGHLNGAINIPLAELNENAPNILKNYNNIIIVYCQVGVRSKKAYNLLKQMGYSNVFYLEGGLDAI